MNEEKEYIMTDIMQPLNRRTRINLSELKARLVMRLGPERSDQYFDCLSRLLTLRLSKSEFDKLCLKLLGKENLSLHNQLIRAVLLNACSRKLPRHMPAHVKGACVATDNESLRLTKNSITPLQLNGEVNLVSPSDYVGNKISYGVLEDGSLKSCDSRKLSQHHQELMGDRSVSGYNREKSWALAVEEENNVYKFVRSQLQAPVGTPPHPVIPRSRCLRSYDTTGGLLDTNSLRERIQQIAIDEGLEGVTVDCANLLNLGLNSYLKTLIGSCIQLARPRSVSKLGHKSLQRDQLQPKLVNGVFFLQEERLRFPITTLDLKAALELGPRELGEDWPLLREKIFVHAMNGEGYVSEQIKHLPSVTCIAHSLLTQPRG